MLQDLSGLTSPSSRSAAYDIPPPRSRWRLRVFIPLIIFLFTAALVLYAARDVLAPATSVNVVPVITRQAVQLDSSLQTGPLIQAPGWIEPDPYPINVPALVSGTLREILVLEGDSVEQDQVVARLVDDDLRLAERSALAATARQQADLAKSESEVNSAQFAIEMAAADADLLRNQLARNRPLLAAGGVAAGEVINLEMRLRGAEARLHQAESQLATTRAIVLQSAAALQSAQIAVEEAQLRLNRSQVRSPGKGIVLARLVAPGSRVGAASMPFDENTSSVLIRLYDPKHLQVRADVPLADAARIGIDTPAEITTEALPNDRFSGRVSRVLHEANIQRNTVQFKVKIENPSPHLRPEMLARVRFNPASSTTSSSADQAGALQLLLDASVIHNRVGDKAQVWVAKASNASGSSIATLCDIVVGPASGDDVSVVAGLNPGDRVIADPPKTLRPGDRVRIIGEAALTPSLAPSKTN